MRAGAIIGVVIWVGSGLPVHAGGTDPQRTRLHDSQTYQHGYPATAVATESLWRHADFLKLWAGQTVSELGSVVTRTAVPLVALLVLGAGPLEMALIVVAASLAVLSSGSSPGAWVDRLRRRPLLIWTDAIRALLLFSIPIAYAPERPADRAALRRRVRSRAASARCSTPRTRPTSRR